MTQDLSSLKIVSMKRIFNQSAIIRKLHFYFLTGVLMNIMFLVLINETKGEELRLLGDQPCVIIDATKTSSVFYLRNISNHTIDIFLNSKNIINEVTDQFVPGKLQFKNPVSGKYASGLRTTLKPDSMLSVEIEVSDLTDAGQAKTYLFNGKDTITTVHILNKNIPFNVSLKSVNQNAPEILIEKGKPTLFVLNNDDAMSYLVDWLFFIPELNFVIDGSDLICKGKSITKLSVPFPDSLFTSGFDGLFKDQEKQGQLILQFKSSGSINLNVPGKTFSMKTKLQYFSNEKKYRLGSLIIFIVLLIGGSFSCLFNIWFPNKQKRLEIQKQLNKLAVKTRSISVHIDSDLRVMIRVERMRLSELTNSAKAFNTDSLQIFDGIKSEIDMLKQRIEIIQKLDIVTQLFQSMAGKAFDAPAKRMYDVNKLLSQATDNLKLPNPEMVNLTVAKENIQQADEKLRNLTKEDPLFSKELAGLVSKLAEIYAEIDLKGTKLEELKEKLKDLLSLLDKENVERYTVETNILPEHYHWLSSSIERLFVLRHYIHIWNMYIDRREIIILSEPDLINSLEKRTWHALQDARQYRFQFKENVYTTQIKDAIQNKEFQVKITPCRQPRPNERVCLEIMFDNPEFTISSAKNDIRCEWDFEKIGIENGWKISHYFRNKIESKFNILFYDEKGKSIPTGTKEYYEHKPIDLQITKERRFQQINKLELIKFSVTFIIALIALFTGAREQILKLDPVSGLIAVFLLGFGADAIKNYISKGLNQGT
jgi:hypothetical protein